MHCIVIYSCSGLRQSLARGREGEARHNSQSHFGKSRTLTRKSRTFQAATSVITVPRILNLASPKVRDCSHQIPLSKVEQTRLFQTSTTCCHLPFPIFSFREFLVVSFRFRLTSHLEVWEAEQWKLESDCGTCSY
jgi:hypothetical protein